MQRNMALIRELLLRISDDPEYDGTAIIHPESTDDLKIYDKDPAVVAYHLKLLIEAGFVIGDRTLEGRFPGISRLTWDGHGFLDNIRDPSIWEKTVQRLGGISSVAFSVVAAIAEA